MTVKDLLVLAAHYDVSVRLEPIIENDFTIYGDCINDSFYVYVEKDGKRARCRFGMSELSINPTHIMCSIADAVWEIYKAIKDEKNE